MARPLRSALALDRDAPSDAAGGDDPGKLGDVVGNIRAVDVEAFWIGRERRGHPPYTGGKHLGSAATSSGFTVDLRGRRKGAPDVGPPRRGLPTRSTPRRQIPGDVQGRPKAFPASGPSLLVTRRLSLPPEFQHLLREHHQHPALRQTPR